MTTPPATPSTTARRAAGPPVEVMVWRITPKQTGRGEHRELVDNVTVASWQFFWGRRHPGPGRYRLEFRDARRLIAKVQYVNALPPEQGGQVVHTQGRYRPSKRTVPPPVDAWDSSTPNLKARRDAARRHSASNATPRSVTPKAAARSPSPARHYPSLAPPGRSPNGLFWRLRKNGHWEHVSWQQGLRLPDYVLLLLPNREYAFVWAPDGRWPGYVADRLEDGTPCLVPSR